MKSKVAVAGWFPCYITVEEDNIRGAWRLGVLRTLFLLPAAIFTSQTKLDFNRTSLIDGSSTFLVIPFPVPSVQET